MQKFYKIVSGLTVPLFIPTYGLMLLLNMNVFSILPYEWKMLAIGGTFFFTILMPALPILWMIRKGNISNVMISKKEERTIPYLFTFVGYAMWTFFLWKIMHFPFFIVSMAISCTISILLVAMINLKWKVSAHMSGMGGLVGSVIGISYVTAMNPVGLICFVLLLSALVALARLELKAHTPLQVFVGFVMSCLLMILPCLFFIN
jgi:hypothetical protein